MKKILLTLILLSLIALPFATMQPSEAQTWTNISSYPYIINTPGNYRVTAPATIATTTGITINCSNVVLDGRKYQMTSAVENNGEHIQIGTATNDDISNVTIMNWLGNGAGFCNEGIAWFGSAELSDSTIYSCTFSNFAYEGLMIFKCDNVTVTKCKFLNNQLSAIYIVSSVVNSVFYNNLFQSVDDFTFYTTSANFTGTTLYVAPTTGVRVQGEGPIGGNYYVHNNGTGISITGSDLNNDGFIDQAYIRSDGDNADGYLTDLYPMSYRYTTEQQRFYNSVTWFTIHIALTLGTGFLLYMLTKSKWGFFMGIFAGMILIYVMIPGMSANLWAFILIGVSLIIAVFAGERYGGTHV